VKIAADFKAGDGYNWTRIRNAEMTEVAPGATAKQSSQLFAGAKEVEVLQNYTKKLGIPYLDYSIDWGWFWFIAIPFFWILHWFFGVFGNFGVAIIGLTIVVRIFMFPIAQKQFASMAQMRAVQPKMQKLQEKYKDDKQRMQQEIMKLYQEEKVNPFAGCLPIVLQIPVFFALYKILMLSIEMRHQPFTLWLKDLSAPDPLTPVNLFGLLPFDPPTFLAIGVLPILLGITMWLMQRLNPTPMDEIQKQVMGIMPWFLMFIMAPFAAGLQLYWVVSNVISIGQQKWLYSRHPILKQQAAKEAEAKAKA
ncbi:membrane protein insertase YidC, partial [Sphingorhabdus sp.]|uniref:membrane protein insertase YidC n=1 Tax=Sphingorhabdus sp. TaxID=1902408 RepID=UPI003C796A0A